METVKLTIENGAFAYKNGPTLFENVNLELQSGELLSVLGPNGAGKTTLLKCMMGLLKWKRGKSSIDGTDIASMSERRLWTTVAYVPQARSASPAYTAFETVLLGRTGRLGVFSTPKKADVEKAEQVLDLLGISRLSQKLCSQMSGGELQMVLIARALAAEPALLVLDEPESNLDFKNQLIVLNTISRLASDGIACIFNTHYPEHALQRSDKALLLSGGEAVCGSTASVVTEANIERAFGVKAAIGSFETDGNELKNVIPLHLSSGEPDRATSEPEKNALAAVTVISHDYAAAQRINRLLHAYSDMIVGRMGMPYRERGVYIIHTSLDGPRGRIEELSQRLTIIPGVSAKTIYAKEEHELG